MEKGYGWAQLSQWETPPKDAIVMIKNVTTGLSQAECRYMLVNRIDTENDGYLCCLYVKKEDVTSEILRLAGEI